MINSPFKDKLFQKHFFPPETAHDLLVFVQWGHPGLENMSSLFSGKFKARFNCKLTGVPLYSLIFLRNKKWSCLSAQGL